MFFKTIDEFRGCVEANAGIDLLSLTPSIKAAEIKFLKPLLGAAYYDSLTIRYETDTITLDSEEELVVHIQNAIANLALYLYVPIAEVQITDAGVRRGDSESAPGAYKYQVKELQKALLERGFEYIELMLEHLDESPATFVEWFESDAYKNYRKAFIKSGTEFEQLYSSIRFPRRMYTLLRTTMLNLQELTIATTIGEGTYNELAEAFQEEDPAFSDWEIQLLAYLKPAIAHLTVARGIAHIVATMDENGVHVLTQFNDTTTDTGKRAPASNVHLNMLINEAKSVGEAWLTKAITYMNSVASATVFPDYYAVISVADVPADQNDEMSGIFGM
jgi:hypothetical protein